ncbi:MAG: hypothetical protein ACE149_19540 [Armatimonadota bacterium]
MRCAAPAQRPARLRRTPVYHRTVFQELVAAARLGQTCLRHAGGCWEPLVATRSFGLYRPGPDMLSCVQERVEEYEFMLYSRLLNGACGRDGLVRPRTHLWRQADGALSALTARSGGQRDG